MRGSRARSVLVAISAVIMCLGGVHPAAGAATATPGHALWAKRYNGPGNGDDVGHAVVVSPDASAVFVTGSAVGATSLDYVTVAYSASTGAKLWLSRYDGPANDVDFANAIAVSPDGTTVFVTGASPGSGSDDDYATVAYAAGTGAQLWAKRYNGPGNGDDEASDVGLSPDGATVFVTGSSAGTASDHDYATVAYAASTGERLWAKRYNGPGNGFDVAHALVVSPDGATVFVTGSSDGSNPGGDYATLAYAAATGARQWVKRYDGTAHDVDYGYALAPSPDGSTLFVTGYSSASNSADFVTFAYAASTGARLWVQRYDGPGHFFDFTRGLGVSPDGSTVFVTGQSFGSLSDSDYATVAYDASTGAQLWLKRYDGPAGCCDAPRDLGVSPDGSAVFVTGASPGPGSGYDYATVAYAASTGARMWLRRYDGPVNKFDAAEALAVSPNGSAVFVTGESHGSPSYDYATVAYSLT